MKFREADITDITQMSRVRLDVNENKLSNPDLVTEDDYVEYLTQRGMGWVCTIDEIVVGFAIVDLVDDSVWALFVHPAFEGRGIGKQLHRLMMDWYFAQGKYHIWLGTAPDTRAETFYTKRGWVNCGLKSNGEIRFELTADIWNKFLRI